MEQLGFHEFSLYIRYLSTTPQEREILRSLLTVTISRFYRNRRAFDALAEQVLPLLAARSGTVRAWSAGCASGEEPYTLRILWEELRPPGAQLVLVATDIDEASLSRARAGLYEASSLREVPPEVAARRFRREGERFRISEAIREGVSLLRHDLHLDDPPGSFDLVLCRNAALTYFDRPARVRAAERIAAALSPGGFLMIGRTETLPPGAERWFETFLLRAGIHVRRGEGQSSAASPR